jgi:hypothetical protein
MLESVGKSRVACIIMDDGNLSENFDLDSGRPQGEILSPIQYNIGNQIFLFKIELDPNIKSLFNSVLGPRAPFIIGPNCLPENEVFKNESERETDKAEGFADDSSAITVAEQDSISHIELALDEFYLISGLKCNFDKSSVTFIGPDPPAGITTRFKITQEFTLLGVNLSNNLRDLPKNFEPVKLKMQKTVNFWARFMLSLPGRIQIAKTFLLSHVNYFGSVIMPTPEQIVWMQNLINGFCLGNLRFDKTRMYFAPDQGGLGLFDLKNCLRAQQSIWVKKAAHSSRDNWRWDLWTLGSGNIFTLPALPNPNQHPVLAGIIDSFRILACKFYATESNFFMSYILNNPLISISNGFPYETSDHFWLQAGNSNLFNVAKMRIKDFLMPNGTIHSLERLNLDYGLKLSFTTYVRLASVLHHAKTKFKFPPTGTGTDIGSFFKSFKKGSKQCRKLLCSNEASPVISVSASFASVSQTAIDRLDIFSSSLSFWGLSCLPNTLRYLTR